MCLHIYYLNSKTLWRFTTILVQKHGGLYSFSPFRQYTLFYDELYMHVSFHSRKSYATSTKQSYAAAAKLQIVYFYQN